MPDSIIEPAPEHYAGTGLATTAKRMFGATRPKFFTASVLPVLVGFAWGYRSGGEVDVLVVVLAVLATAVVHAASNVYNDVGDDINGSDPANIERIHPFTGGSRFIQNGVMTRKQMLNLSIGLLVVAMALGGALIALKGITVLWLGLAGIAIGLLYSMPAVRLMSRGVGEIAVAIAFGVIPVSGAGWLATGRFDAPLLWLSLAVGLWVAAILQINEVPDIQADRAAGKRNIAVRFGVRGVVVAYLVMQLTAFAILVGLALRGLLPLAILIVPALLAAIAVRAALGIVPPPDERLATSIKLTLLIQLAGCAWLTGALVLM